MADSRLDILIDAQDRATKHLQNVERSINEIDKSAKTANKSMSAWMGQATQASQQFALGMTAVGVALGGVLGMGVKVQADLETARQGFVTLLGDAKEADEVMRRIKIEAARTPFELVGLTKSTQLLSSVTKDGGKAVDIVMDIGEALAAMGKGQVELDRIIVNLQQVGAIGKASMVDIKQFAYAGIPIFEMLQKETGLAGDALADFISNGSVSFEMLTTMFDKANDAGGAFFNAYINQAGTFNQLMANMSDVVSIFLADIVEQTGVFDALKNAMAGFINFLTENQGNFLKFVNDLKVFATENGPVLVGMLAGALTPAFIAVASAIGSATLALAPFIVAGALIGKLAMEIGREFNLGWGDVVTAVTYAQGVITSTANAIVAVYKEYVEPAIVSFARFIKDNWGTITNIYNGAVETVKYTISQMVWVYDNVLAPAVSGIADLIASNWDNISTVTKSVWESVTAIIQTAVTVWEKVIKPVVSGIKSTIENNWGAIKAVTTVTFTAVSGAVSGAFSVMEGIVKTGGAVLRGDFKGIFDAIKDVVTTNLNNVKKIFESIFNALPQPIKDAIKPVGEAAQMVADVMLAPFKLAIEAFKTAGRMMGLGLESGFMGTLSGLQAKTQMYAQTIIATAQTALRVQSPSRVFMEIGGFVGEGLAIGMEERIPAIAAASKDMINAVVPEQSETDKLIEKVKEMLGQIDKAYTDTSEAVAKTWEKLNDDHAKSMEKFRSEITKSVEEIRKLDTEFAGKLNAQASQFGSQFVKAEQSVAKISADLSKARMTGGSAEEIYNLEEKLRKEQEAIRIASEYTTRTKEEEIARIQQLEEQYNLQKMMLEEARTLQAQTRIQAEMQHTATRLEFAKMQEKNLADEQRRLLLAVQTERKKAGMSEMELFLFNMEQKRVEEENAYIEKRKQEEENIKNMKQQIDTEITAHKEKLKAIVDIQIRMQQNHKLIMDNMTRITQEETNKQIAFYNELAKAAERAAQAKNSVGVKAFADGGMVPFPNRIGTDTVPAMLTPGEIVLNAAQQRNLAGSLQNGGGQSLTINVNTLIGEEQFAEQMLDMAVKKLSLSTTY